MNKKEWKKFYRLTRVARRETMKAAIDMMIYGTGFMKVSNDGSDPEHVPFEKVKINYEQ